MLSPTSPTSALGTQQQLRVSPLADIAADPATFLAARTARAMLGRDVTPCVVHILNALLHAVVRAVVLAATQGSIPTVPLAANNVIEALQALAPIDAVLAAAVSATSSLPSSPAAAAAPLLPAQVTGAAISDLIIDQAQTAGCYDQPAPPAPQAVVALNAALDVVAGLLLDSLAVALDVPGTKRLSIESVVCAITSDPDLAHVVRNVGWLEVLELLADEHDDDDEDVEAEAPQFMFPTLLAGTAGAGSPDSPMHHRSAGGPAPIMVDPSVPSPAIRSPGMSARHPPLPSPSLTGSGAPLGRLPKGVKPGPLDDFDELLISSETKKITLTPKRLRVVEAGGSSSSTTARVSPSAGMSNISTTSLPTVSNLMSSSKIAAGTPTLPTSATFTSLPMPTRSPPFSPSTSSRPIVSNPSATWDLAEFLNTTEPPAAPSSASPASTSTKSFKSSRSSGFFGKKFASSKNSPPSVSSPSPPPPVPTTALIPERLPPGHPKFIMLPGADEVLRQFSDSSNGRPASMAQARRRSQAKPSEPDPASSTVSTSIATSMPPVPSPPPPAAVAVSVAAANSPHLSTKSVPSSSGKRRSHSPAQLSSVSATVPEGSAVAARMRATLAAAMAEVPDVSASASTSGNKRVSRSASSASAPALAARASMVGSASPAPPGGAGRKHASLPRSRSMSRATSERNEGVRDASEAPAPMAPAAAQSHSGEDDRGRNAGTAGDTHAPRRSSSVTRDRTGLAARGAHGASPARVPVGAATSQSSLPQRGASPVRQQVVPADQSHSPPMAAPAAAMIAPAAEPSLPTASTSAVDSPVPLPTLPPLPDSLADLTRADLERLVRLLHADATTARHVADHARAAEAAHKAQLDKLAVRAFKTITDLRKRDVEREAEMEAVRREREQVGTRLGQVLAVLGGVVPGLISEEEGGVGAEGVVRSES